MEFIHDHVAAQGHVVDWLCADDVPVSWNTFQRRFGFTWLVWRRARDAARAGKPYDIVNVHEPHALLISLAQRRFTRLGVVVTSHGLERRAWDLALEERRLGRGGPSPWTRVLYPTTTLWQSRIGLTRARFVFALSNEDREYLSARLGVPPSRTGRMRPGASDIFAAPAPLRTYDSGDRLLFSGTWRKNKGVADLVTAFKRLALRYPTVTLTVLGAGVAPGVVSAAFPADIRHRVTTIEAATDSTAVEVLGSADIFLLPSLFEGTPLTLIEAMMSGLPVVTTATCGMKDVVEHGYTGLLVPLRSPSAIVDAVARLVESRQLRETLGRQAHEHVREHYTWDRVAQDVLSGYEQLGSGR